MNSPSATGYAPKIRTAAPSSGTDGSICRKRTTSHSPQAKDRADQSAKPTGGDGKVKGRKSAANQGGYATGSANWNSPARVEVGQPLELTGNRAVEVVHARRFPGPHDHRLGPEHRPVEAESMEELASGVDGPESDD